MSRRSRRNREAQMEAAPITPTVRPVKIIAICVGILLLIAAIVTTWNAANAAPGKATARSVAQDLGGSLAPVKNGVQEVSLSMQGYEYQPNPVRVKVGVPVKMTVDLTKVRGCMRSIQIPELGVSGRVSDGNNVITFTPTKAGTFRMTCSMGMADGTIIVEDANGQAPAAAPSAAPLPPLGGGSCGSGGCGCGG